LAEVLGEKALRPLHTAHPQITGAIVVDCPVDHIKPLVWIVLIQAYLEVLCRVFARRSHGVPFDIEDPVGRSSGN
jgi:hypothetical protein